MRFDIITIFPKIFDSYFNASILKRAREKKLIDIHIHNVRDFSSDKKHHKVDDRPFGGGAGMVLMVEPILKAVAHCDKRKATSDKKKKIIILSAKGKQFNQKMANDWSRKFDQMVLISGRYEGIDERVKTTLRAEEISIGPYVLTDGEVAIMAIVSAVARLLPGVIKLESLAEESHGNFLLKKEVADTKKGFEYPHYTRPEVLWWKGKTYRVPRVLLSGHAKKIKEWREQRQK